MASLLRLGGSTRNTVIRRFSTHASYQTTILDNVRRQAEFFGVEPSAVYDPALPVEAFQTAAQYVHDNLTHDWGLSFLSLAAVFRVLTFPLYASSLLKGKRRAEAARDLTDLRDMAKEAVLLRDQTLVQNIDKEYKQRMGAYGLSGNPLQGFGYLFCAQLPWVTTMLFLCEAWPHNLAYSIHSRWIRNFYGVNHSLSQIPTGFCPSYRPLGSCYLLFEAETLC